MTRRIALALLGILLACDDGRLAELEAEVKTLEEKRVTLESVEKARAEAEQAELELAALAQKRDSAEAQALSAAARTETLVKSLEAEQARLLAEETERDALRSGTNAVRERLEARRRILAERRGGIEAHRSEVRRACERVVEIASQIRDEDPAWATARRIEVLDELVRQVAKLEPGDLVIRSIAASKAGGDPTREARERAERLRARLVERYAPGARVAEGACPIATGTAAGAGHAE